MTKRKTPKSSPQSDFQADEPQSVAIEIVETQELTPEEVRDRLHQIIRAVVAPRFIYGDKAQAALHKCGMNWRLQPLKIRFKLGEIIPRFSNADYYIFTTTIVFALNYPTDKSGGFQLTT